MKKDNTQNNGNSFTRGSQVFAHNWRMKMQGFKTAAWISAGIVMLWWAFQCWRKLLLIDLYYAPTILWSYIKLDIGEIFYKPQEIWITVYDFKLQTYRSLSCLEFHDRIWQSPIGQRLMAFWDWLMPSAMIESVIVFAVGMIGVYWFFARRGRQKMVQQKTRGNDLVSPKQLTQQLKKAKKASDIQVSGLPLVKYSENQHILITGGTGTGKTNLYHEIIPQLKARGDKLIFLDMKGTFFSTYYDEQKDKLLNPIDERSLLWLPWADCDMSFDYDAMANAIAGKPSSSESFWEETPKKVIAMALEKNQDNRSIQRVMKLLNRMSFAEYSDFFKGTDVATMTAQEVEKTATSIRATVGNKMKPFSYLRETDEPFSIKQYILNDDDTGALFMTVPAAQRESLLPIISAWIEVALKSLMQRELGTEHKKTNIWFIMDELPALKYIPSLKSALAECREYGGCVLAGIQNIHQLIEIYGRPQALNILDQFSTRFIFRCGDKDTAEFSSQNLGEQEVKETQESLSYGANSVRDGVSLNNVEKSKRLVLPTEIMTLDNFCCYAKLAGNWPIARLKMKYNKITALHKISVVRKDLYSKS